jgi:hypothetical protein
MNTHDARQLGSKRDAPWVRRATAGVLALALALAATPAWAVLAEVTTSVSISDTGDAAVLERALRTAVDGVLENAISFKPTVLVVTAAIVVGDRLYVRMLVADEDGERIVGELGETREAPAPAAPPELKI